MLTCSIDDRCLDISNYNYGFICFSFQICQFLLHVFWSYPVGGDTLSEFSSWWIDLFIISFFFLLWSLLSDVTIVNSPFVLITVYMVFHHLFICDLFVSLYFRCVSYRCDKVGSWFSTKSNICTFYENVPRKNCQSRSLHQSKKWTTSALVVGKFSSD